MNIFLKVCPMPSAKLLVTNTQENRPSTTVTLVSTRKVEFLRFFQVLSKLSAQGSVRQCLKDVIT